jgi:glycosyltransferase involved in cell wall biosynthesis
VNVVVSVEHRFELTPDGAVWTQTQFPHRSWQPYLRVFDSLRVVARVRPVETPTEGWIRSDGPGVTFAAVPYYVGPVQYLARRRAVRRATAAAVSPGDAIVMRVPSTLANNLEPALRRAGRPFGVEVVGDPYDVFAPGANRHPLAPFFRWYFPRRLRAICRHAVRAAYVTREALQRRYPCPQGEVGVSDVELPDEAFTAQPRAIDSAQRRFVALMIGTLAQLYKAPDVLIDAIAHCRTSGTDVELVLVGDGQFRGELEERARRLGIGAHVHFRGQLAVGEAVRRELDAADLFVLPSHQEGLPRAMVEAMARGLPCVGSAVGGIPELLAAEDLVSPGDATALAAKMREVLGDPDRRARMSRRNLETARTYRAERLAEIRCEFYRAIRDRTAAWLAGRSEK